MENNRKKLIAGNWKMNKLSSEIGDYVNSLCKLIPTDSETILCVNHVSLENALALTRDTKIEISAQDVSKNMHGAYTGEVSAEMLSDIGVKYCLVGHSERRSYHSESDLDVNIKIKRLLSVGISPIICIGESLELRQKGEAISYTNSQVKTVLEGLSPNELEKCLIAYEPIWAIGTGISATNEEAEEMCREIREYISVLYSKEVAEKILILYGGSMNTKNCEDLLKMENIDGGLIGGASLKTEDFSKIILSAIREQK